MKRNLFIITYLVLFFVFFIAGQALGAYDDFSGAYIDGQRWNDRELVREVVGGKLVSKAGNGPWGCTKNYTEFQNPLTINVIQSDVTVVEAVLDAGTDPSSRDRIQGFFYRRKIVILPFCNSLKILIMLVLRKAQKPIIRSKIDEKVIWNSPKRFLFSSRLL